MADFTFDFVKDNQHHQHNEHSESTTTATHTQPPPVELLLDSTTAQLPQRYDQWYAGTISLWKVLCTPQEIQPLSEATRGLPELVLASDLQSGVYEGGFKLWECAQDLLNYFVEAFTSFEGRRVLEVSHNPRCSLVRLAVATACQVSTTGVSPNKLHRSVYTATRGFMCAFSGLRESCCCVADFFGRMRRSSGRHL